MRELTDKNFDNFISITNSPDERVVYFYDYNDHNNDKLDEEGKVKLKFLPLPHS